MSTHIDSRKLVRMGAWALATLNQYQQFGRRDYCNISKFVKDPKPNGKASCNKDTKWLQGYFQKAFTKTPQTKFVNNFKAHVIRLILSKQQH